VITEETVYTCTGSPLPADIETIVNALFTLDFTEAYASKLL
jgi:replication factor C subunit 3/5